MTHRCDTEEPRRPCCWAARNREFDQLAKMDAARTERYGSQSCPDCGKVYSVDPETLVAADHDCHPMTTDQLLGPPMPEPTPDFETALAGFLEGCQEICTAEDRRLDEGSKSPGLNKTTLTRSPGGRRYVRIVNDGSAWCFVDKTNGDVLKPASWKTPAKHARGNVYDEFNGLSWMSAYGPAYLR